MSPVTTLRSGIGLLVTAVVVGLVAPRRLPPLAPLAGPAEHSTEFTAFGLRLVAAAMAGYLALVFLVLFLGSLRLLPSSAQRLVRGWTTKGLAGGLRRLVGTSALMVGVLPLGPAAAHVAAAPAPVLAPAEPPDVGPTTQAPRLEPVPPEVPDVPPPTVVDPPGPSSIPPSAPPVLRPPRSVLDPPVVDPPAAPAPVPARRPAPATVRVATGDSFWSIAERLVAARLGRPAGDAEVVEPWLALIAANRDRLVDPTDPGLLLPGQVLRVPPPAT